MPAKGTTRPKPHPGTRAKEVSTTVPAEGTTLFENFIMLTFKFQLPCPRRARQSPLHGPQPSSEFQLPCPRRARLLPGPAAFGSKKFQLPCPRRARLFRSSSWECAQGFNYRARGGHDILPDYNPRRCAVSTTVPAEGTTLAHKMINRKTVVSTTVPAEGTTDPATRVYTGIWFQLPCPRRARPGGRFDGRSGDCFNYRARGGHDVSGNGYVMDIKVSTTVPAEGTTYPAQYVDDNVVFQLPCPRRARLPQSPKFWHLSQFQLPCPRRARRNNCFIW